MNSTRKATRKKPSKPWCDRLITSPTARLNTTSARFTSNRILSNKPDTTSNQPPNSTPKNLLKAMEQINGLKTTRIFHSILEKYFWDSTNLIKRNKYSRMLGISTSSIILEISRGSKKWSKEQILWTLCYRLLLKKPNLKIQNKRKKKNHPQIQKHQLDRILKQVQN